MGKRSKRMERAYESASEIHADAEATLEEMSLKRQEQIRSIYNSLDSIQGKKGQMVTVSREAYYKACEDAANIAARDGFEFGAETTLKVLYACLAEQLVEEGWDSDDTIEFVGKVDRRMATEFDDEDAIMHCFERTGLKIISVEAGGALDPRIVAEEGKKIIAVKKLAEP